MVIWPILFILFQSSTLAFDCSSVQDASTCGSLNNCVWSSSACTGTFSPVCDVDACYYIDPTDGSDTNDGSVQNPFKTLTTGLNELSGSAGSLIIINYLATVQAELLSYVEISSSITIK